MRTREEGEEEEVPQRERHVSLKVERVHRRIIRLRNELIELFVHLGSDVL